MPALPGIGLANCRWLGASALGHHRLAGVVCDVHSSGLIARGGGLCVAGEWCGAVRSNETGECLMSINRSASAYLVGAALSLGLAGFPTVASAADMPPVKAVPMATPWVLDVHGGADITFANTRVTGGGLYLYSHGYLTQINTGLQLDIYKNPVGIINSFSVFGGVWNELWNSPPVGGKTWQEMDWWIGFNVGFAKYWNFSAQYMEFDFPTGGEAKNYDFKLSFSDSFTGWPITINP